jgi:hypothetical protein
MLEEGSEKELSPLSSHIYPYHNVFIMYNLELTSKSYELNKWEFPNNDIKTIQSGKFKVNEMDLGDGT